MTVDDSKKSVILSNNSNSRAGEFNRIKIRIERFFFVCLFSKLAAAFQSMEVRNSTFACFIELCTPNTYVMVVISDPTICKN